MRIDLNSDVGEHYGAWRMGGDEAMLEMVTSANVACGFHAGDPRSAFSTLQAAAANGVKVGAHVAYPDLVGFGRREMNISSVDLTADVIYQIGALQALAKAAGTTVDYVKPHGALYNSIAHDERQAAAVIEAILAVDPSLALVCLAGSSLIDQARGLGLRTVAEAFADRAYEADGSLTPRTESGAVLHDPEEVGERMLRLVREGTIEARDGSSLPMNAESICVHGDSNGAIDMARALSARLSGAGVEIRSFVGDR